MRTDELDFELPADLIAQAPAAERAASRLLHYRRDDRTIAHRGFAELPGLLKAGDVLVFNDAKVTPARFTLRKDTGGRVEGLFLADYGNGEWGVMLKNLGPVDARRVLRFVGEVGVEVRVMAKGEEGQYRIRVGSTEPALAVLARVGRMPLPPYIRREKERDERDAFDRERYQTVYARAEGSVAAPTAGLHFTPAVMEEIRRRGVEEVFVTLHVGLGTFKPVTAETLEGHAMHVEAYTIPAETAAVINRAKREGRRVIAVGTTAARVLESQAEGEIGAVSGETGIFIYPPYRWKHVGAMVTNFHLPRSTLIALVAAMVGLEEQRRIYREAVGRGYRFFSYGDASFIE